MGKWSEEAKQRRRENPTKGFSGKHHSKSSKDKLSEIAKNRETSNLRPWNENINYQERSENVEWHQKLSQAKIGKPNKALKGRDFTDEHRENISQTLLEKYANGEIQVQITPESKDKQSQSMKVYWSELPEDEKQRRINAFKTGGINKDTKCELKFEQILRDTNREFEKNKRIGRFLVDFYLPNQNLIVEIQGCYWHACEVCGYTDHLERRESDKQRKEYLESQGFKVLYIWEHQL